MHISGQTIQTVIALGIVAVAAAAVGRRLWAQAIAFRAPRRRPGVARQPAHRAVPTTSPLIQIQRRPPVHLTRPPADE